MEPYNFWQDFLGTFRSSSDTIKTLWLIVPPVFVVALTSVILRSRPADARHVSDLERSQQKSRIS